MAYVTASFSGGKDSTAMVLHMLEIGEPLDEVIFYDTGMEYPIVYDHIAKVERYVKMYGVKFTVLRADRTFKGMLMEDQIMSPKYGAYHGYGWPSMRLRWCTRYLKLDCINHYLRGLRDDHGDFVQCVGLAYDEIERARKDNDANHRHPLIDWRWTEAMCLEYCYSKGFDWYDPATGMRLYDIFSRVSCWICPLGRIDGCRKLRRYYPELWNTIGEWEAQLRATREAEGLSEILPWKYKPNASWAELDARFAREDELQRAEGLLPLRRVGSVP